MFLLVFNNNTLANGNDGLNRVKRNSQRKYFLPRVNITNYNVLVDERNFYGQPVNSQIKMYDNIGKIAIGYGDDYTTGCL